MLNVCSLTQFYVRQITYVKRAFCKIRLTERMLTVRFEKNYFDAYRL